MACAALHDVLTSQTAATGRSAWQSLGAWRIQGGHTLVLLEDEYRNVHEIHVSLEGNGWRVRAGDLDMNLIPTLVGNILDVQYAGLNTRFTVALEEHSQRSAHIWLAGPSGTWSWRRLDRWQRALQGAAGAESQTGNRLLAPMPGLVTQVQAQVGMMVAAGDVLVQMEAMKMVHTLSATAPGRITELRCNVGDAVRGGDVLAVIEEEQT